MKLDFLKRILKVLLIPPLLFFANEVRGQCDVYIEPGTIQVVDNGSGVQFLFDITNNSAVDYEGGTLKMYWSLNSAAPIWNFDFTQNTTADPIAPGETRSMKTPWFDIPNLPSWFPDDPTTAQPWVESQEWPFYGLSFPFQGSWSPMILKLDGCGNDMDGDNVWDNVVYDSNGDFYYGPFNSDCPNANMDQFCDCEIDFLDFNHYTYEATIQVNGWQNCATPLNNGLTGDIDGINSVVFGIHIPGWDYPWGCTSEGPHPGWSFMLFSNLNIDGPETVTFNIDNNFAISDCWLEILEDADLPCREIVLWQINYSKTANIFDFPEDGWAVNPSTGNGTIIYPDIDITDNRINYCNTPNAYPPSNGLDVTCVDNEPFWTYDVRVFNNGLDTLFTYCVEIPELGYDECFDGYVQSLYWIAPNQGQYLDEITIPTEITEFTVNVYNAGDELDEFFFDNSIVVTINSEANDICEVNGCTDPEALNYDPLATLDDGSCQYLDLTLDLGNDIIWTPQGTCVDPFYNQSFVVNNTGEGVIDNFSLEVTVVTWDGDVVYNGTQDYNVSIDPNDSYTVSDFPDIFTGDLNYVNATLTWVNELGEIEEDMQSFNLILYCWGCTDPEANNYIESEYIFDEIQYYWLNPFPNTLPPTPDQIECTYDIFGCTDPIATNYNPNANIEDGSCNYFVDISLDTLLYTTGCDEFGPYWSPTFYFTNEGDVTITELCIVEDLLGTPQPNDTVCFNNLNILPGQTYTQDWPNMYEWDVLTVRVINVNGDNGNSFNDFGFDDDVADNMYVQVINDTPNCTEGCTDPDADNYNPNAVFDDGSCEIGGCTIEQACNYNLDATYNDGSCDFESCVGCTDPEAMNYNPNATEDDGSCIYPIYGCTDPEAFNYDPLANTDDGSCIDVVVGCMIPEAVNYNPLANIQCTPIDECCIFPEGCTDPEAINYDPNAIIDDGSCNYDVYGCTNMDALNYNPYATIDDGTCIYPGPCDEFDGSAFAPNAFTPNNDGLNDVWRVLTEEDCWNRWELIIYNRWGQVVYEMDSPSQFWDGSFRGGDYYVSDGVYAYTLRGVAWNLSTVETTGFITVLR
jgi:gliding motility-associated-like protein